MIFNDDVWPIVIAFCQVGIGLTMLVAGGELLVSGASRLAKKFGMSSLLIGLTVVAFGTSVPELFVSVTASLQGYPEIMIGNVIGSNIANVGLILGFSALLTPLKMRFRAVRIELFLVILGSFTLIGLSYFGFFPRLAGVIFAITLVCYTFYAYKSETNGEKLDDLDLNGQKRKPIAIYGFIIIGLVLLSSGSNVFITGAVDVARHFGISELIIGLTLAAIGTSLPELASSLAALRRNETKLLVGNIIGSNMFNLFMVLGFTAMLKPFSLSPSLLQRDLPVMTCFTLVLVPILVFNKGTNRWHGILLIGSYIWYCLSLL